MFLFLNGTNSEELDISCGVPQGSTLGPLLFLLYINDLRFSLQKAVSSHFADDTCIMFASKKPKTLETVLNYDLNFMKLNKSKENWCIQVPSAKIIYWWKLAEEEKNQI